MKVKYLKSHALKVIEAEKIKLVVEKIKNFEDRKRAMKEVWREFNTRYEEFLETPLEDIEDHEFRY